MSFASLAPVASLRGGDELLINCPHGSKFRADTGHAGPPNKFIQLLFNFHPPYGCSSKRRTYLPDQRSRNTRKPRDGVPTEGSTLSLEEERQNSGGESKLPPRIDR
jgi:hypothetical protein